MKFQYALYFRTEAAAYEIDENKYECIRNILDLQYIKLGKDATLDLPLLPIRSIPPPVSSKFVSSFSPFTFIFCLFSADTAPKRQIKVVLVKRLLCPGPGDGAQNAKYLGLIT